MNKDKYDLETEINNCWNITKDLDDYLWRMFDSPEGPLSEDEQMNILIGLISTYNMKFEKLLDTHCQVFKLNDYAPEEVKMQRVPLFEHTDPPMVNKREEAMADYLTKTILRRNGKVGDKPFKEND